MIKINNELTPFDLSVKLNRFWLLSGQKIRLIDKLYDESKGSPVYTINGKYSTRGWTEWTQGFQYGSALLQFDITGEAELLAISRKKITNKMAPHISHTGVHDHGFNNLQEALDDYNFIGGRADNKHHLNELHGMDHALGDMGEFHHEHP